MKRKTDYVSVYIAEDGKKFLTEEDCIKYEKRASTMTRIEWLRQNLNRNAMERNFWKKSYGKHLANMKMWMAKFDEVANDKHRFSSMKFLEEEIIHAANSVKYHMEMVINAREHLLEARKTQREMRHRLDELSSQERGGGKLNTNLLHRIRCHAKAVFKHSLYEIGTTDIGYGYRRITKIGALWNYTWAVDGLMGKTVSKDDRLDDIVLSHVVREVWKKEKPKYMKKREKNEQQKT